VSPFRLLLHSLVHDHVVELHAIPCGKKSDPHRSLDPRLPQLHVGERVQLGDDRPVYFPSDRKGQIAAGGRIEPRCAVHLPAQAAGNLTAARRFRTGTAVAAAATALTADAVSTAVASPGPARRILVADDNVDSAESLAMLLRLQGHQVDVVHDGIEALRRLEELRPQFALIDIGMPKVNGYEVARRTRAEQWGASISLIPLTGWGQEQDRQEALEAGFNHHFVKPVDTQLLLQKLNE
jgi:CheY-like chemotaxis protein